MSSETMTRALAASTSSTSRAGAPRQPGSKSARAEKAPKARAARIAASSRDDAMNEEAPSARSLAGATLYASGITTIPPGLCTF
jgi:hypothetical protein